MDKQKKVKTECSKCGSEKHVTRKCTSSKCGECGKTFKSAPERSMHWKREHLGKGSKSRSDDDKPAREPDADNFKKDQSTQWSTPDLDHQQVAEDKMKVGGHR